MQSKETELVFAVGNQSCALIYACPLGIFRVLFLWSMTFSKRVDHALVFSLMCWDTLAVVNI